jgi:uncharacterized protein YhaN
MMALRIEEVRFKPWGSFADHPIEFAGPGTVDMIYGENATGKSTTGRGIRSLLFGMDARTVDDHTFPYSELKIDARISIDGRSLDLSRVKKPSASLLDVAGRPLTSDPIAAALGGLGPDVYRGLFHVDSETLDEGAEELLGGGGEIGESLFAAAAGIRGLHATLAALEAEAQDAYNPPRGRKGALETALRELQECEKRMRAATLRPQRHSSLRAELRAEEARAEELGGEIRSLAASMRAVERRRTIAPLIGAHSDLRGELAPIADSPALPVEAATHRASAQARLDGGRTQLTRARKVLKELDDQISAVVVDEGLLARGDVISMAKDEVSAVSKAAKDRRKLEGELYVAKASLSTAAQAARTPVEDVGASRLAASATKAVDGAVGTYGEISKRLAVADERLVKSKKARDKAADSLQGSPEARELAELEAALGGARALDGLSGQISALEGAQEGKRQAADRAFRRLVPRPRSISELGELDLPSVEEAEEAATRFAKVAERARTIDAEAAAVASRQVDLEEEGDRIKAEGAAPTFGDLTAARGHRTAAWGPIRVAAEAGERLDPRIAGDFESAIDATDQLADRRADAGERVGRAASHEASVLSLEREQERFETRRQKVASDEEAAARAWSELWMKSGLEALPADSAPAWFEARERVLDLDSQAAAAAAEVAAARDRESDHSRALRAAFASLEVSPQASMTLAGLCTRAATLVEEERGHRSTRLELETDLRGKGEALGDAEEELALATQEMGGWQREWPNIVSRAGLAEGVGSSEAQELVRALDEAAGRREEIGNLERRISGIDADRKAFADEVRALCESLAPELLGLEPEAAAAAIHAKLSEQRRQAERVGTLAEQRERSTRSVAAAEEEIAAAEESIKVLLYAAGTEEIDRLPEIERRSDRARELRGEIESLERRAVEAGGADFASLVADADGFDRDADAIKLDELAERAQELTAERDVVRDEIVTRRRDLTALEVDAGAVRAREDIEMTRGRVEAAALTYARARLAGLSVRRAMERYRREHQSPMLDRAKELFRRFTQSTFSDLYVDVEDGGKAVLIGRQYDGALMQVGQMSKGTREQLFLALRIAAIDRYVETAGPVPVIFDDVFSESDEPRSERIFEALGELARTTQVTVLTHHRHLIDVAGRALGDRLVVQQLPTVAPALRVAEAA